MALHTLTRMETRHFRRLAYSFAVFCIALPLVARGAPRDVVDHIATLIENNYFEASKAGDIAKSLRESASAGQFDRLRDPRDLAATLTSRLQPLDHHFLVTWSPPEAVPASGQSAEDSGPAMSFEALARRNAYGFHRVEMLPGAIGYLDITAFADFSFSNPNEPARKAADAALALVSTADAIIIDLRNNGGGAPNMVGYMVSAFTPPGADIYNTFKHRDRVESERPKESYPSPRLTVPLFILVSGRTASAAESTAYTLQAAKRAVVVGESSVGAANPGGEFPAGDGFFVFVSTSTTVNPITGTNWEKTGVKPDVPVDPNKALERAEVLALESVLACNPNAEGTTETRWVLDALRARESQPAGAPLNDYEGPYAGAQVSAENGHLALHRGKRPSWILARIRGDVFCVLDEPYRRVIFERNATHQVTRFQVVRAGGPSSWFNKSSH
jgi:Peptidase family S41/N-terminal domain of Peptidase_S41 in eukaryotic IRBP